jgi:hypothetical protein
MNTFDGGKALVIGIGPGYPEKNRLPIDVRNDAEQLAKVLLDPGYCGYRKEYVELILDSDATRSNILAALNRLASQALKDDTIVIFFSGHGGYFPLGDDAGTYLFPVDYNIDDLRGTAIEADELSDLIKSIPAARVLVIVDACHAENTVYLKGSNESQFKGLIPGLRDSSLDKLSKGQGRVVLSSCLEEEQSATYAAKGHSVFTYCLLEGLRGAVPDNNNDGTVKVFDLFEYLSVEVAKHARPKYPQHPVIKGHAQSNFPIALRKGGWLIGLDMGTSTIAQAVPISGSAEVESVLSLLYPAGPNQDELWSRAGGDLASLNLTGNGKAQWHRAIKLLIQGGGTTSLRKLLETACSDYPHNTELCNLASARTN